MLSWRGRLFIHPAPCAPAQRNRRQRWGASPHLALLHCNDKLQPARPVCAIESKQPFMLCMCLAPACACNISEKNTTQSGVLGLGAHWGCSARRAHWEAGRSTSARRSAVSRLRHHASCHGSPTAGWKYQTDSGSGSGRKTPQHLCGKGRSLHRWGLLPGHPRMPRTSSILRR